MRAARREIYDRTRWYPAVKVKRIDVVRSPELRGRRAASTDLAASAAHARAELERAALGRREARADEGRAAPLEMEKLGVPGANRGHAIDLARLDRHDAVALFQRLVERALQRSGIEEAGRARRRQLRRLDADRRVIAEPQPADAHDRVAFVDLQRGGRRGVGRGQAAIKQPRADDQAEMAHLLREAGQLARAGDQRRAADEGAAAVLARSSPCSSRLRTRRR